MSPQTPMSPTDFHILLVLSQGALYGYALKKALEEETDGAIDPEIGSLYRVLARLVSVGFVEQVGGAEHAEGGGSPRAPTQVLRPHPGG